MKSVDMHTPLRLVKKILDVISSPEFLAWIIGAWILYYISSMIWTKNTFAYFMSQLGFNLFIRVLFLLFLISGYLNLARSLLSAFRLRKRYALLLFVLPAGCLIFFTGFFISAATRQFEWIVVGKGDSFQPKWSSRQYMVEAVDPGIKERFLDIDIGSGRGLFKYEPKVTVRDDSSRTVEISAFPPAKSGDSYFHVLNFGLSPGISLSEGDIMMAQEHVPLNILGPGSNDFFTIEPLPYKFLISLEPEKTIWKGALEASEFSITSPNFRVRVLEGDRMIVDAVSKEEIKFNNMKLSFSKPEFWVKLEIVKDYGYPVIIAGILISLIGIPVFLLGLFYPLIFQRV